MQKGKMFILSMIKLENEGDLVIPASNVMLKNKFYTTWKRFDLFSFIKKTN